MPIPIFFLGLLISLSCLADDGERPLLKQTLWWKVAIERNLDPYILYAVALVESAKAEHKMAAPWPWALNKNGSAIMPSTQHEARRILQKALIAGDQIDVGLMQVNIRWNGYRVAQPVDLLDPTINIKIGADILSDAIQAEPHDLTLGIGRYHAGWGRDKNARAYAYGRRVLAIAHRIRWLF